MQMAHCSTFRIQKISKTTNCMNNKLQETMMTSYLLVDLKTNSMKQNNKFENI